ncbi:MAG: DNA gyrase inhibitor YacG, partial [Verrucomicrobiota bacterium]
MKQPSQVKCPTCRKVGDWFAGRYGPFCSKRCRLVDLGKWLGEENKISEPGGAPVPRTGGGIARRPADFVAAAQAGGGGTAQPPCQGNRTAG